MPLFHRRPSIPFVILSRHYQPLGPRFSHSLQISHTLLRASRRTSNFSQGVDHLVDDRRNWNRSISSDFDIIGGEDDEDDEDEENEEEDRSLDLLVRFVENVFRKVSKRARKAVRSVLPQSIPTKLVICTLGTAVFVSILIIRGVWTGILYLQDIRSHRFDRLDDDQHHAWTGAQPAS